MVDSGAESGRMNPSATPQSAFARVFADYLDSQKIICDELEAIADSLPRSMNKEACLRVSQALLPLLKRAHQFEESQIFPLLTTAQNAHLDLALTIGRMRSEHLSDEDYAEDLCKAILNNLKNADRHSAENLGWMLRGFFESIRRHIAFDREHILPLIEVFK